MGLAATTVKTEGWRLLVSDFRQVTPTFWASPQISVADVTEAAGLGVTLIINNRPEGESPDQTPGQSIAEAAGAAGLAYCAIPVSPQGFTQEQVDAMNAALGGADGKVLAYCRSGTRSTFLWSLAQAAKGAEPADIAAAAAQAGYDIAPIRPLVEGLHARSAD